MQIPSEGLTDVTLLKIVQSILLAIQSILLGIISIFLKRLGMKIYLGTYILYVFTYD